MYVLIIALAGLGLLAALIGWVRAHYIRKGVWKEDPPMPPEIEEECCGQHSTCEKDSLLAAVSREIEYYEDEELDRFRGRDEEEYTEEEVDEFQQVLSELKEEEIAGWVRSLQLRQIAFPEVLKDELLLIMRERRLK